MLTPIIFTIFEFGIETLCKFVDVVSLIVSQHYLQIDFPALSQFEVISTVHSDRAEFFIYPDSPFSMGTLPAILISRCFF